MALIQASAAFCAAEAEFRATHWAEDNQDNRPVDRGAALARCRAARKVQAAAVRVLIEQPAATLLGLRAKAQAAVAWYGNEPPHGGPGESILWSMAEDASRDFDPAAGAASP